MPKEKDRAAVHPLLAREILPIYNWREWLACWQATENLQWIESLLHVGFTVSLEPRGYGEKEYNDIDRIMLYFTIADGWDDNHLLYLPTDKEKEHFFGRDSSGDTIKKRPCDLRQQLARKAFDMLYLNVLKIDLLGAGHPDSESNKSWWETTITSERLLLVIQHFFRVEKESFGGGMKIRNLPRVRGERSHNAQQAATFLLNLAKFIWRWKEPDLRYFISGGSEADKRLAEKRARVDAAKPWTIEVLSALGRVDLLRDWILKLDQPCLAKLEEIAMQSQLERWFHPVAQDRPVVTLDEACFAGSEAAWFLKKRELLTREYTRLKGIREAEEKRAEANRKIAELTTKK